MMHPECEWGSRYDLRRHSRADHHSLPFAPDAPQAFLNRHSVETQQHWRKIRTLSAKSTKQISEPGQHKLLARSNGMSRLSSLLIVCAALSAGTGFAHAGTCADQITQLRQVAQLDHQPTPETVGQVHTYGQLMFAAALAEAEALNAEGNEAGCLLAAGRAKQMRELG
jgi:hypothetical protein